MTGVLPACCTAHVAAYVALAPTDHPRTDAALCCAGCAARLVYHDGTWQRTPTQTGD